MRKKKIKKPIIDWIKFDSWEEAECYQFLKKWKLHILTWIEELKNIKLIDPRPKWIVLFDKFYAWSFLQRSRSYKWDFTILDENWIEVCLEYKSKWSESKPDYRLRRFLVLLSWKIKLMELVKIKKWVYELRKYY